MLELHRDPGLREALGKMLDLPPPDTSSRALSLQEVKDAVAALGRTRFHMGQHALDIDVDASTAASVSAATFGVKSVETEGARLCETMSRSRSRSTRAIPPWPSASPNG